MNGARAAVAVPVALRFAQGREDSWGRLLSLSAQGAEVCTLGALAAREKVFVSFELAGERFKDVPAVVEAASRDADGYCAGDLTFLDEVERRRLAKALVDLLSRS